MPLRCLAPELKLWQTRNLGNFNTVVEERPYIRDFNHKLWLKAKDPSRSQFISEKKHSLFVASYDKQYSLFGRILYPQLIGESLPSFPNFRWRVLSSGVVRLYVRCILSLERDLGARLVILM